MPSSSFFFCIALRLFLSLSFFHSIHLSSTLSLPRVSSSGCLWAQGRACPSWACTSASCMVRPAPSAAWREIPTARGTDTPAAPTCPPCAGRRREMTHLHPNKTNVIISNFKWFQILQVETNVPYETGTGIDTWKQSSLIRFKPHVSVFSNMAHITSELWLQLKHFFPLDQHLDPRQIITNERDISLMVMFPGDAQTFLLVPHSSPAAVTFTPHNSIMLKVDGCDIFWTRWCPLGVCQRLHDSMAWHHGSQSGKTLCCITQLLIKSVCLYAAH